MNWKLGFMELFIMVFMYGIGECESRFRDRVEWVRLIYLG